MLDSGSWRATLADTAAGHRLTMTSPPDPRTGLQVTRAFDIPATGSRFRQSVEFRNVGADPVRWAVWEVCQVATVGLAGRGVLRVGAAPDEAPVRMIEAVGEIDTGRYRGGAWEIPVQDVVGKLGFTAAERFVALDRGDGTGLRLTFDAIDGAPYPDGGARVELWLQYPIGAPLAQFGGLHPQAHLVELEVLGPLVDLAPGQATTLEIGWDLA